MRRENIMKEHKRDQEQTENMTGKQKRSEKRAAKKAAKKAAYAGLDRKGKYRFWLKRAVIVIVSVLIVFGAAALMMPTAMESYYYYKCEQQAPQEDILAVAAPDEDGAAKIDAMKQNSPGETWAIYIYMSGSNLESFGLNELSSVTGYLLEPQVQEITEAGSEAARNRIMEFVSDMNEQGMDLPDYMYLPERHEEETGGEESGDMEEMEGSATSDIKEMLAVELPENIKIIIQTGGSPRWSQDEINPNRSQRFIYDSEGFRLLEESPVQNMGSAETLKDFLKFCKEDYSADHKMLSFWNHGGGVFGVCWDDLYGSDYLSLKEVREALAGVYKKNEEEPPFDIIGYDACLMASMEVAESLNGYGKYLVASEELEPGTGWDYTTWLGKLAEHPEMNGAQLAKAITDSYIEFYANQSIQLDWLGVDNECTFSIVDISKAHEVYEAYGKLASVALRDSIKEPWVMAALGTAAGSSVRYAQTSYKVYNTVDLGLFMDNLMGLYPEEAGEVIQALDESVIYNRATSYGRDSQGLSVYFPAEIEDVSGLNQYLKFVNEICEDPAVQALYYYKLAGCLNQEMQAYADSQGYGKAKVLNIAALEELTAKPVELLAAGNFRLPVDAETAGLIQDYTLNIAKYDEENEKVIYYGEDQFVGMDESNTIYTEFEGKWIAIDGHILATEIIDANASFIRYRAPVCLNGEDSYLILAYDFEQEKMSIIGVCPMAETTEADTLGRNVNHIKAGDILQPIYETDDIYSDAGTKEYGKKFRYWASSKIEDRTLENGTYFEYITICDTRGDEYYTQIIQFQMQGGKVTDVEVREDVLNIRTSK